MKSTRRQFLKLAGLTAATVALDPLGMVKAAPVVEPLGLAKYTHKTYSMGTIVHDGSFSKALWPGIQEWYGEKYDEIEFKDLF